MARNARICVSAIRRCSLQAFPSMLYPELCSCAALAGGRPYPSTDRHCANATVRRSPRAGWFRQRFLPHCPPVSSYILYTPVGLAQPSRTILWRCASVSSSVCCHSPLLVPDARALSSKPTVATPASNYRSGAWGGPLGGCSGSRLLRLQLLF